MRRRTWHSCDPLDLHRLARRWFVDAQRIELAKLASELGISRATAYRWAGSAEQLIGEVLASLLRDTFKHLRTRTTARGPERVLEVVAKGMRVAHQFAPLRQFLTANPQAGLKIVASRHGPVQAETIKQLAALISDEIEAGHMQLSVAPEVMAYALTRIVESFLYADLITGTRPDLDSAREIIRLLLRPEAA